MKDRTALAQHFKNLGFTRGAEIGVLGGTYSIILCRENSNLTLFSIDSWGIGDKKKIEYHQRKYEEAKQRLAGYNTTLIRKLSLDAVKDFEDESLDFVYIDANHNFNNVMRDIIEWTAKVRKGGIISGHDYMDTAIGVKTAVDAFVKAHKLDLRVTRHTDSRARSWFFVKK